MPENDEQQADAEDVNPFADEPDEDAPQQTFLGYIGEKTQGDFAAAREMINYYMHRLAALQGEMAALTEDIDKDITKHEAKIDALKGLKNTRIGKYADEYQRITWQLEGAWMDFRPQIKDILGRGQTWHLTDGSISAKKQQPELVHEPEAAVRFVEGMDDLEAHAQLLKHTTELRWAEFKKLLEVTPGGQVVYAPTGEILQCVAAEIRGEQITITIRQTAQGGIEDDE